jgi:uncharacterized protein YkwD
MKTKFLVVAISLFFIFLYSCRKGDVTVPKQDPPVNSNSFNVQKDVMLQRINSVRAAGCTCGSTTMPPVAAISWSDQLAAAAYHHSKDMFQKNYFSHTGANGSSPGERIVAAGYNWKTYGENIAKGYASEEAVIAGWLASEGHCKNIMNPSFKEMGAGREGSYWTQLFGSR